MSSDIKVIVIGLDGATFDLIIPWVKQGELKTFKKLLEKGVYGELKSTTPFATIPAWPSFSTGCNPGKHGFYDFLNEGNNYTLRVETSPSKIIKKPTLWKILGEYNKKVSVINVPSTYPPTEVNGHLITGMLTPPGKNFTFPHDFESEILEKVGKYNVFFSALSSKNPDILLKDLNETLSMRMKVLEYLWTTKNPDFLMMVDNGTDRGEHELWKFLDIDNPLYNPNDNKKYGNPLLKYYKTVDLALQKIINLMDKNTILFIISDHGQGSLRKFINLNNFLIKEGFMTIKKSSISRFRYFLFRHGFSPRNIFKIFKNIGLERVVTDRVNPQTTLSILERLFFSSRDIDWEKTKAYASGVTGAIKINLSGRQPKGVIKPGKEYEQTRNEIIKRLSSLKDIDNGNFVVNGIYKREEIYEGPYIDESPDIIANPSKFYEFFGMHGFTFSNIIENTFANSGGHTIDGIFLCYGKGIKEGEKINNANIMDVAPTILSIMNVPVPKDIDGKILFEIFNDDNLVSKDTVEYQEDEIQKEKIKMVIKKIINKI